MALAQEAIRLAAMNAGLLGLIGAPTYPMLRDVTERAVFEVLEENEIPHEFQKQEHLLTLTELGSEIIFRSMEHPERLIGTNLAWFGVDEMSYCKHAAFLRLQARLRHPMAKELCGFGVWTPNGYNWVYDVFIGPNAKPDYTAVLANPRENSYLTRDFYDKLNESYDPRFAQQEVLGEYLNLTSGTVYFAFSRAENIHPAGYLSHLPLIWTMDFNVNPMCSLICQIEEDRHESIMTGESTAKVRVIDEIVLRDSNTEQACEEFARRADALVRASSVNVEVYGDATGGARHTSGRTDYEIIKNFFRSRPEFRVSYHVKGSNPPVRDKVNSVNALLRNAAGIRRTVIDPRCKMLIHDLERTLWKADASGNTTGLIDERGPDNANPAGLSHISDAFGYMAETRFGLRQAGGPRQTYIA